MKFFIYLFTLFFFFLYITPLNATSIDLGTSYDLGAVDSQALSLNAKTKIQKPFSIYTSDDPITLATEILYSESQDDITKNNGLFRAGYDPGLSESWALWFYEEIGYNHITGVDLENFAGGGTKYKLLKNASISFGCLHHYIETRDVETKEIEVKNLGRWSLRGKVKNSFGGIVIFYQPNMADFEDYILKGEAYIKYKLRVFKSGDDVFYFKLSIKDQYRTSWDPRNELSTILSVGVDF